MIGKPCDIEAIINYTKIDEKLKKCIKYTMTFFCAGAPSKNATLKLAENLGVQADQIQLLFLLDINQIKHYMIQ